MKLKPVPTATAIGFNPTRKLCAKSDTYGLSQVAHKCEAIGGYRNN